MSVNLLYTRPAGFVNGWKEGFMATILHRFFDNA